MRLVTWNINSVRLRLDLLRRVLSTLDADLICLQEIKVETEAFPAEAIAAMGYPHQVVQGFKGYHGTAILSRVPLKRSRPVKWCGRDDGRHAVARLPGGEEIHSLYIPAGGDIPDRQQNDKFAHKLDFVSELADWCAARKPGRRILLGDFNIAPLETDVWSHKQLLTVVSHTPVEVDGLSRVRESWGWVDAVREFIPPEQPLYTWWSYRNRTWPGSDRGRRLDHIWVTPRLAPKLKGAQVLREARGWPGPSDHVPVSVDIDL